ncbi:hypothetical protein [Synechococcus sp. RS9916]|uniref:hypothetical protein n=1 Tax=Synechococcus sp. RS9916 TaxID=221359 RepID=UPI00056EBCED|nr:hypothetical protein [Synechococcus sp. RS9916]
MTSLMQIMLLSVTRRVIAATGLALLPLISTVMGVRAESQPSPTPPNQPPQQRHRIEVRSSIEVRVSTMVERDCNDMQITGQLQPQPLGSGGQSVWRLMSDNGQPGGDIITTVMGCEPDYPITRERLALNNGSPTTIPWQGKTVRIDLPKGWLLEWRPTGSDQPFQSSIATGLVALPTWQQLPLWSEDSRQIIWVAGLKRTASPLTAIDVQFSIDIPKGFAVPAQKGQLDEQPTSTAQVRHYRLSGALLGGLWSPRRACGVSMLKPVAMRALLLESSSPLRIPITAETQAIVIDTPGWDVAWRPQGSEQPFQSVGNR